MSILSKVSTKAPKGFLKDETKAKTKAITKEIAELQHLMYAESKHSLLLVFQGMDASGKDGVTKNVFKYCSPSAIAAKAFKKPSEEEFAHDFLWRVHKHAPKKGRIQIFNRSHYEDVLIQRVHGWIDEDTAQMRIRAINAFEELLQKDNNTTILKFYMHISPERQKEKLQERIDDPLKQWKHNPGDWKEREHWDKYMECFEDLFQKCTIPWIIAPVDQRWYRDYFIASKVLETMKSLDMKLPLLEKEK